MKENSRQYKNSVFCLLFDDPDKLRSLYNSLTGLSYSKDTPVIINTLQSKMSLGLQNDISFTIGGKTIVFAEHQSTVNPNMPVRLLIYMAELYGKHIPRRNLYGKSIVEIPKPEFFMFYNGKSSFPERKLLKLSDSFAKIPGELLAPTKAGRMPKQGSRFDRTRRVSPCSLELEVHAYNINAGYNKNLLEKNRDLGEYAEFVDVVRNREKDDDDREEAYRLAINECIDNNILREFLEKYKEEVMSSLLNISREEYIEIRLEEAREEAREESRREKLESARKMKAAGLSAGQIGNFIGLSSDEIEKL